jgi:hypothetical protein
MKKNSTLTSCSALCGLLAIVGFVAIVLPTSPVFAAASYQQSSDNSSTYSVLCGFGLLVLVGAVLMRVFYSNIAPTVSYTLEGKEAQQVVQQFRQALPDKSALGRGWKLNMDRQNPNTVVFSTHPIPQWMGCIALLFTGILPGALAYIVLNDIDKIYVVSLPEQSSVRIDAKGFQAKPTAEGLKWYVG